MHRLLASVRRGSVIAAVAALTVLGACSKKEEPAAAASAAPDPDALEGQLDIVAWAGYIERGETDKAYDWVTQFEKDTGCKVNVKIAGTSDEMVSLMTQGGYDLVTASGDASLRLIRGDTVQPVDVAKVPAYATVDQRLKEAAWHFVDGKHYGVPYQWGPNVLVYNTKVFKSAPTSWSVVFEEQKLPDGKPNKGRVQAYDGPIYIADAALYLMTKKPDLGIKNPYELNEAQYNAALDAASQAASADPALLARRERAGAGLHERRHRGLELLAVPGEHAGRAEASRSRARCRPKARRVGRTPPCCTRSAKHPNCAYKWMEWSLTPKVQGDVAAWFGSVPAVPAACENHQLLGAEGCKTNGIDNFDKIHFWRTPEATCASQGTSACPIAAGLTDYVAIMGGR